MFNIYDASLSPNEGTCLRYIMIRCRQMGGGVFTIYDEPESPNWAACLICTMNRYCQMRGRV